MKTMTREEAVQLIKAYESGYVDVNNHELQVACKILGKIVIDIVPVPISLRGIGTIPPGVVKPIHTVRDVPQKLI